MDKQTRDDMESMAEWASTMDAYDRLTERRSRRAEFAHRFRYFIPWPVAIIDDPVAAVPASGECSNPRSSLGAGTGVAGSKRRTPATAPPRWPVSGSRIPGDPPHHSCSEASRISAALNRH